MAIGNTPNTAHFPVDTFSGDASTTGFTLTQTPGSASAIEVHIGSVWQVPTIAFTVSGGTLTFTSAPPSGTNNIVVVHKGVQVQIPTPADGSVGVDQLNISQFGGEYIKLSDVKATTVAAGTFTAGAWQTRDLNTEDTDTGNHCSLSTNQFTLDAGTYRIFIISPAFAVNNHQVRLQNITDVTTELEGEAAHSNSATPTETHSFCRGQFTIAASKTFEIHHRCATTAGVNGFGVAHSFGGDEIYTVVELWKVK